METIIAGVIGFTVVILALVLVLMVVVRLIFFSKRQDRASGPQDGQEEVASLHNILPTLLLLTYVRGELSW